MTVAALPTKYRTHSMVRWFSRLSEWIDRAAKRRTGPGCDAASSRRSECPTIIAQERRCRRPGKPRVKPCSQEPRGRNVTAQRNHGGDARGALSCLNSTRVQTNSCGQSRVARTRAAAVRTAPAKREGQAMWSREAARTNKRHGQDGILRPIMAAAVIGAAAIATSAPSLAQGNQNLDIPVAAKRRRRRAGISVLDAEQAPAAVLHARDLLAASERYARPSSATRCCSSSAAPTISTRTISTGRNRAPGPAAAGSRSAPA